MALTRCRECKHEISDQAQSCPDCGAPYPARAIWTGTGYEWKSERTVYGYPLVHIAFGRDARGKFRVAKGVIAIGQFGIGLITFAQIGVGFLFGFGQFIFGLTAVSQIAVTLLFGCGQIAIGYAAVGQVVVAWYGLAQAGLANYLWSSSRHDPEAAQFFIHLAEKLGLTISHFFNQ